MVFVDARRRDELRGDLRLGGAEDHARLLLAFGLGLARHRILECDRNRDVANLDRADRDSPRGRLLTDLVA